MIKSLHTLKFNRFFKLNDCVCSAVVRTGVLGAIAPVDFGDLRYVGHLVTLGNKEKSHLSTLGPNHSTGK